MVRFDLGPLLQGQTTIVKLKSADNLLVIGPRGLQYENNLYEVMGWESSDVFRFDLGAPFSRSNDGPLALVSCLFGGYKFASVLQCSGLVQCVCLYLVGCSSHGLVYVHTV